jgi:hypothetical protein
MEDFFGTVAERINTFKRRLSATILLAGSGFCLSAVPMQGVLVVFYNDGMSYSYVLADKPKVIFDAASIMIYAADVSDSHLFADVRKFYFTTVSGMGNVKADERRLTYVDGNNIILQGFCPGTVVTVYRLGGMVDTVYEVSDAGVAEICITDLPQGVYLIVTSDGKSYKIMKK